MTTHRIATREEWAQAHRALVAREKELTRMSDELARRRRELPWVPVEKAYEFDTAAGRRTLAELFGGKSQLIVYHFMFAPEDTAGCTGCSFVSDHLDPAIVHASQRDLTVLMVSRAPLSKLLAYKERMGWGFEWVSSYGSDFNYDFEVSSERGERPGLSAFALEDGTVFHTYSSYDRGLEILDGAYHLLDRAPKGRDEDDLEYPSAWWRRHDEYEPAVA